MIRPSLRTRVETPGLIVVPVVYDALSARVASEAGFEAVSLGSMSVTATLYGLPDTGFMSLGDMVDHVRRIRAAVPEVMIVADAEAGFGNPVHVVRAVRELEAAGADALHIEDQLFGKHLTLQPEMASAEVTAAKISAAVDARSSSECLIIARTDTQWATPRDPGQVFGPEEAIRRSNLFAEAGADMVLLPATPFDQMTQVAAEINVPVISTAMMCPDDTKWSDFEGTGVKGILYHDVGINSAIVGVRKALNGLASSQSLAGAREHLLPSPEVDVFLGIEKVLETAQRFCVIPCN
jgi:methylisocitrate lyase